jgi:hypothetical protein
MINHTEKLKYSIGVDSLALLSACEQTGAEISWDFHDNNVDYAKRIRLTSISIAVKKLNSKGTINEGITECDVPAEKIKEAKTKIEAIFQKIRADLNREKGKLIIEQIDTTECNKIRVTIESAIKWADDILEIDISKHFPHASKESDESKFEWGPTKVKNNLEYIAVLFELLLENQKQPNAIVDNESKNFTHLLEQIEQRCKNPEGDYKTIIIRLLYNLASSIKKERSGEN